MSELNRTGVLQCTSPLDTAFAKQDTNAVGYGAFQCADNSHFKAGKLPGAN